MSIYFIVDRPDEWPLHIADVEVIAARAYLTDPKYSVSKHVRVFNLCKSYRYQSVGYYVSLLAAARGHRPLPNVRTTLDLKSQIVVKAITDDLLEDIQKALHKIHSDEFVLSIYFGRNVAARYDRLCLKLFNLFEAPLLRAKFVKRDNWELRSIRPVSVSEIPESHYEFLLQAAKQYFASRKQKPKRIELRYDIAVLYNPNEEFPPSNEKALQKFSKAAEAVGLNMELVTADDYHRVAEFDALFIRETTAVNHYTFRFAQRASAEGLVVIDDPESIIKCTNKVYLAEVLSKNQIPIPKTRIIYKDNADDILEELGTPCVLKQPDSAFSVGVKKVDTAEEYNTVVREMLRNSDLVVAQEFLPTDFDWRIGVCDGRALYACRYHMAEEHWQVIKRGNDGKTAQEGNSDTVGISEVPERVLNTALAAAKLIGNGLYGIDLKEIGNKVVVMEINDNPSIEAGCEDAVLKDALYREIMGMFIKRIEQKKK